MGATEITPENGFNPNLHCELEGGVCNKANIASLGGPCVSQCDVIWIEDQLVDSGVFERTEDSAGEYYVPDMLRRLADPGTPDAAKIPAAVYPFAPKPGTKSPVASTNMYVPERGFA